jgi:hypothetical protein
VNLPLFSSINSFVSLYSVTSGLESIARAFLIQTNFQTKHHTFLYNINVWHDTLYQIGSDNLEADVYEPLRVVVIERTFKGLPKLSRIVLTHIGIHNQYDESGVEKLTNESAFYDTRLLLTYCIFSDPANESHNDLLDNRINGNNYNGNGKSENLRN